MTNQRGNGFLKRLVLGVLSLIVGQVSAGFIDMDTPLDARTTKSLIDGSVYDLVRFSHVKILGPGVMCVYVGGGEVLLTSQLATLLCVHYGLVAAMHWQHTTHPILLSLSLLHTNNDMPTLD